MRRFLPSSLILLWGLALPLASAGVEEDAIAALQAANAKVAGLSAVRSPSASNLDAVKGELADLEPFFRTVGRRLQGIPLDSSSRLLALGGSITARIETAGKTSTVDIAVFLSAVQGLLGDLQAWQALVPQVLSELQRRVEARTQNAVAGAVATVFPTAVAGVVSVGASVPTPTPVVWPTATPLPVTSPVLPPPTPISLPPIDGGLIPGGPGAVLPSPTPLPVGQPTPGPTPRAAQRLLLPVAAGRNNQTVWVGHVQAGSVGVFDVATRRFVKEVAVGAAPLSLALDDGDNTLVVANSASNSVSLIDARKNEVTKTLAVGAKPVQVLVIHGGKAYVACQDARRVDVIDLRRQILIKSIRLDSRPGRMDVPNSHQTLYISLPDEDRLAVIDTSLDEVIASVGE
jgi:YVTN family beta-propeller protein